MKEKYSEMPFLSDGFKQWYVNSNYFDLSHLVWFDFEEIVSFMEFFGIMLMQKISLIKIKGFLPQKVMTSIFQPSVRCCKNDPVKWPYSKNGSTTFAQI